MKPRLLILSDLFGGKNPKWIKYYTEILESKFDIQYYDVLKLGEIEASNTDEKDIHNQFLKTGIDKAVQNLLNLEKEEVTVLGFSIGGTIAWKASLKGLNVCQLFAVSSTRLRFETEIPNCKIKLYFGGKDLNLPDLQWFFDLKISNQFFKNQDHQLYFDEKNAFVICNDILNGFD
jgi:pimeloyl-ACP methyl ester carboxylesterase